MMCVVVFVVTPALAEASYYAEGTVLSTNMLSGASSVTAIASVTVTTTLPANTAVKIKYSQDNVNFYNAAGTQEGWDNCAAGTNTIDISALGWSTSIFYYKLQLTTTDSAATPVASDVQVNYTGSSVPDPPSTTHYQRQGTLLSTNVLSGAENVTAIASVTVTTTLPGGATVKIKYSQDNVNFYNAAGTQEGWDNCAAGTNTIDISALGWTGGIFYYKLQWETIDDTTTPIVSDVQVDYTGDDPLPPDGNTYQQIGTVVSTDLMTGVNKPMRGTEYFAYSIRSLPGGSSIKVQFSQDGNEWYAADGTLWGESTLSAGVHMKYDTALSLATLGWEDGTHFYYKLTLTTTDNTRSPVITYAGLMFAQSTTINSSENSEFTNGLVGLWSFNGADVSGTTAYDRSGQGNNGTLTNGPTVTTGKIGQALSFDGVNQYVTMGNTNDITTGDFTLAYWMKPDNISQFGAVVLKREGLGPYRQYQTGVGYVSGGLPVSAKKVYFFGNNATSDHQGVHTTNDVVDGQWHHVTVTRTSSGILIYIDGVSATLTIDSTGLSSENFTNTGNFTIAYDGGANYKGLVDEARIYNRALSATEIWNLYQAGGGTRVNSANSQVDALERGLAGYWKLDDGSGTTATDASTNGNTSTLTNGPTWTTGQIGGAVSFDGSDDYVNTTSTIDTSLYTVCSWVYPQSNGLYQRIITTPSGNTHKWLLSFSDAVSNSQFVFSRNSGSEMGKGTGATSLNTWHHVCGVWDGTTLSVYLDGVSKSNSVEAGWLYGAGSGLRMGRRHDNQYPLNGRLDEVRVYTRALSAEEIAKLYKTTAPDNPDSGFEGYWSFNGPDVSGTTASDRSGQGNHGTLTNSPTVTTGKIGQALNFDGSNDCVTLGTLHDTGALTLSAWIYPNSVSGRQVIVGKLESGASFPYNYGYGMLLDGSTLIGMAATDSYDWYSNLNATVQSGVWQHVVFTITGSSGTQTGTLYVNGVLADSHSGTASVYLYNPAIGCGLGNGSGGTFNGKIDEVRSYSRALSATEVTNLYNLGR